MNVLTTRELKERLNELQGQTVMLQGWIRNRPKGNKNRRMSAVALWKPSVPSHVS